MFGEMNKTMRIAKAAWVTSIFSVILTTLKAHGDHGSGAWKTEYRVPKGSQWVVSWLSPYELNELRGSFDISIISAPLGFEAVEKNSVSVRYKQPNCDVCITATSRARPATIVLKEGTVFRVFNDLLIFDVAKEKPKSFKDS